MNIKEVENTISKIQNLLFKNSNSISIGLLKSSFRGSGLQFKEHQVYNHGDDVRFIDWKLLAKTNHPYIKTFEEERNVRIVVILDVSLSMFIGHKGISKLQAAIEITCLLYLLAEKTGDKVQTIIISDKLVNLPFKSGKEAMAYLVMQLSKMDILNDDGEVNIAYRPKVILSKKQKFSEIMRHVSSKKEVVILSDFINFLDIDHVKQIKGKSNLHSFQISSPIDHGDVKSFTVYGHSSNEINGKSKFLEIDTKNQKTSELEKILGKKLKKLNVKERYLEEFIKELT